MMEDCDRELSQHIPRLGVHIQISAQDIEQSCWLHQNIPHKVRGRILHYIRVFFKFPDRIKIGAVTWHL